ncbi:class I SAM-dependent DNA methyltransferase [Virgibacillus kimchii]
MAYRQMAGVYDALMTNAPYNKWLEFTKQMIHKNGKSVHTIVDLGCGTGEIALRLAEENYRVIGVDVSSEMLTLAAHKANEKNLPVHWIHQDMRELDGFRDMDLVISYCDSMNYMTTVEDVRSVFERVASSLKRDGLFIFDVHSLHHMEYQLKNRTFADVTEDASYIWFCSAGEHPGEAYHELTFFSLENDKYIRFDELHHQRTFSVDVYKDLLVHAGFKNIKVYGDFSFHDATVNEDTERLFFTAEK